MPCYVNVATAYLEATRVRLSSFEGSQGVTFHSDFTAGRTEDWVVIDQGTVHYIKSTAPLQVQNTRILMPVYGY